jgi:hypothetical protein
MCEQNANMRQLGFNRWKLKMIDGRGSKPAETIRPTRMSIFSMSGTAAACGQ